MIETMLASDFYKGKNIFKYDLNWSDDIASIKRNSKVVYKIEGHYEDNMFIKYMLNKFGLIDVKRDRSHLQFASETFIDASVEQYNELKDLLISIYKNKNALEYKFFVSGPGTTIWNKKNEIVFHERSWIVFIHSIFRTFDMTYYSSDNSDKSVQRMR
jgi:hypothetical protein